MKEAPWWKTKHMLWFIPIYAVCLVAAAVCVAGYVIFLKDESDKLYTMTGKYKGH